MKYTLLVLLILLSFAKYNGQSDSTGVRNYFGANISPLGSKLLGDASVKSRRFGFTYRRCLGLYNLKIAMVGVNDFQINHYTSDYSFGLNDTTYVERSERSSNKSRDFRIGLERKWGSKRSKLFLGAGVTLGKYYSTAHYSDYNYNMISDSTGVYLSDDLSYSEFGREDLQYLKIGIDVWGGIAWDIGEFLNFMIQINPDLSYYKLSKNNTEDPSDVFYTPKNKFTYLALNSIDLMIGVRF